MQKQHGGQHAQHRQSAPGGSQPVLVLESVTKSFGSFAAVSDMNLAVEQGDVFGFLGPNGAGKTTTIKLILDVLRPNSGSIQLFGTSNRHTVATHGRLGYLSGEMVLDDDLTGRQYLDFVAHAYSRGDSRHYQAVSERQQTLTKLLQADLSIKIGHYSRGNKQKIGLIAAMMHQPELLILDEPSSGFDPLLQEVFIGLIREYQQEGGTVFMSSHSLAEVQRLCDRVGFIRGGKLVAVTNVSELSQSAAKRVIVRTDSKVARQIRQATERLHGLKLLDDQSASLTFSYKGAVQPLLQFFAGYQLEDLTIQEPELEDVFMEYYQS